jgi:photosystem II stability/assembly factor-like uncharacterized protein
MARVKPVVRCQRARPLGRENVVEVRRLAMAAPMVLPLVLLLGCGGATQRTTLSTTPRSTAPAATSTSAPLATAIPPGFHANSVTFVSTQLGWVLGTTTCVGDPSCTPILVRTEDAGRTWTRIPLPPDSTVDQVRFADSDDGWVWDDQSVPPYVLHLWSTHDGGLEWQRPHLPGAAPGGASDVEAAAGLVSATVWSTTGGPLIETSSVETDNWRRSSVALPMVVGGAPSEQIVLAGTLGWLIDEDRGVLGGARLVDGAWEPWTPPCVQAGNLVMLAASDPAHVVAICDEGEFTGPKVVLVYFSSDGGSTFQLAATSLPPNRFGPVASPAPGVVIMGVPGADLVGSFDGGKTWAVVYQQANSSSWLQVGFTTPNQGVAIDTNGTLLMTFDGGHDWAPVIFSSLQP